MTDNYKQLSDTVRATLAYESEVTQETIRERIQELRKVKLFYVSDEEADKLAKEIETSRSIKMELGSVIKGKRKFTEWLDSEKANIDPYYWDRYKQLLNQKDFPWQVITRLDEVTDRILGLLENPKKEGTWDRRGMVVGHVQSGKTANYTGLICKAADAGYSLIVVIAGIHNSLRNQTQVRVDEGFVGRDSSAYLNNRTDKWVGVGKFNNQKYPLTLTNTKQDFRKSIATNLGVQLQTLTVPAILVIKKNATILKNLYDWLKWHNAQGNSNLVDAPMLLIDDEADNASINVSKDPELASTINRYIRELLAMFSRRCYVGYTATPFANIFIEPDTEEEMPLEDLFPRDFIVSLEPPDNYFGSTRIFGDHADVDVIRPITDNEDLLPIRHRNYHEVTELPISLLEAIRTFVLARSIRMLRGQENVHNSMLVNVSRFTSVQRKVHEHIHDFMSALENRIRYEPTGNSRQARKDKEIRALHDTWNREYSELEFSWDDIFKILLEAVAPITTMEINSRSSNTLDYDTEYGRQVIAIGGFSLSRGLTLEGLLVSYFLRNSMMYDTLMQMGRWFGYRPGYEDICRIWMTPDAKGWYDHITETVEELRDEFRRMEQAKLTPKEFGLKVRSHPDTLIVTARNKMGSAEQHTVQIGLSNRFIETHAIPAQKEDLEHNLRAAKALVAAVRNVRKEANGERASDTGNTLFSKVPAKLILDFIRSWRNAPESLTTDTMPVSEYISRRESDELNEWDVVVVGVKSGEEERNDLGIPIKCQTRTVSRAITDCISLSTKQRVASRGAEKAGLSKAEIKKAERSWKEDPDNENKEIADRAYRKMRERPLLLIHLLKLKLSDSLKTKLPDAPFVAWGISFPESTDEEQTVEYVVNTTWINEKFGSDIDEDDPESENEN